MPSRENLRLEISQWSSGIRPTWSVAEVRSALRQHADGDFSLSAQLIDSMGEDDVIPGIVDKRIDAVFSKEFCLNPVEAPNRQLSQRIADRYEPLWFEMFPESELDGLLRWYLLLGVSVGVLDWTTTGGRWESKLRTLHPQWLRWDDFNRRWLFQAREGELVVTPGDGRWVLLADGDRGWMRGAVRPLAINWLAKQQTIRDWNRYNERHGLPIIKAFAPALADDGEKDDFWDDIATLGSETVAQLPSHLNEQGAKFDLELLEARDGSWQSFKNFLDRCDRRFMIHILGSHLSTEIVGQGSLAAAKQHAEAEQLRTEADAERLSTEVRRQALFPTVAYNMSASLDVIPWPKWDTEPPVDTKLEAEEAKAFFDAVSAGKLAGYEIENIDEVAERHGLKLKKLPTPALPAPAAPKKPAQEPQTEAAEA